MNNQEKKVPERMRVSTNEIVPFVTDVKVKINEILDYLSLMKEERVEKVHALKEKGGVLLDENDNQKRKCEPDGLSYLSNPPQSKCKNCGRFWFTGSTIPTCRIGEVLPNQIYPFKHKEEPARSLDEMKQGWQVELFEIFENYEVDEQKMSEMTLYPKVKDFISNLVSKTKEEERNKKNKAIIEQLDKIVEMRKTNHAEKLGSMLDGMMQIYDVLSALDE